MVFNKAFVVASHNWKVMLKALFCQIIILALIAALSLLFFGDLVEDVLAAFSSVDLSGFINDAIQALKNQTFDADAFSKALGEMFSQIGDAIELIPNVWNRVEVSYAIFLIMLLVYRLLISFTDVSVGFQINEFMTSNASRPFTWYAVKKFGESWRFISLQMLMTLPLDVMILICGCAIFLLFALFIGSWAFVLAILAVLVLYALRHTAFAFWLPSLVSEELGVRKSLTKGMATIPYRFGRVFWKTLLLLTLMSAITIVSLMYLENAILKLIVGTVPNLILFFLLKCVNLVEYFEHTKRPYFCKFIDVEGTERFNRKAKRRNGKNA